GGATERLTAEIEDGLHRFAGRAARFDGLLRTELRENVPRSVDDGFGNASEIGDVDPVGTIGRTLAYRTEERHVVALLLDRDVDVRHPIEMLRETRELVVVGR